MVDCGRSLPTSAPSLQLEPGRSATLSVFVAATHGAALLAFYIMQARMEVALAKERESVADVRAALSNHQEVLEEKIRAGIRDFKQTFSA